MAVRFRETIYSLPSPKRHHDVIREIAAKTGVETVSAYGEDQGFLDEEGRYLTRKQALEVAREEGQLRDGALGPRLGILFSEDVW